MNRKRDIQIYIYEQINIKVNRQINKELARQIDQIYR